MAVDTRPVLPGVYPEYTAEPRTTIPPSPGAVVAVPILHDWGPVNDPKLCEDFGDYETWFGKSVTPGRIAVYGAFVGEGLEGAGGAGAVLVSRIAGADALEAFVVLDNPAAADAFRIEAKYVGTRGNDLRVTVTPVVTGIQEVVLLDGTVELESFTYRIADGFDTLLDAMTGSGWVVGSVTLEGVTGLAPGTFPLTGGDDGDTLTGADWVSALEPFNDFDFAVFAPFDVPWEPGAGAPELATRDTVAAIVAWRDDQEARYGHRFTVVVGGALDELPADAIERAESLLNPGVISVGGPGFNDDVFGALSTSQLAPRIAGVRAARGEGQSMDLARLAGGTPRPLPTGSRVSLNAQIDMVQAGVIVVGRDRWQVAPSRIVADVNTYQPDIGSGDPDALPADRPKSVWGNPKFVLSMQQFANSAQAEVEREMIGKVAVNDDTRAAAAARVLRMVKDRERTGAFAAGSIVEAVPGADTDKFVRVKVTLTFGRALAQLFIDATVR